MLLRMYLLMCRKSRGLQPNTLITIIYLAAYEKWLKFTNYLHYPETHLEMLINILSTEQ